MKNSFEEMTANRCKYSECIPDWFKKLEVIEDLSYDDYQGGVCILSTKEDKYYILEYSYGSCAVCDDWEERGLSDEEITKEIEELILEVDLEKLRTLKYGFKLEE